jgi:hypothetical protein
VKEKFHSLLLPFFIIGGKESREYAGVFTCVVPLVEFKETTEMEWEKKKRNKFIFLFEFFFPSSLLHNLRMMDRPFLFDFLVASDPLSNDGWKMLYRIKRETCYVYSWKRWFFPSSVVVSFWTENAT